MYLSTCMCVYVDNMTCKWHWTISTQWQDEEDEVEFQEDSDQDVSDDFDGDTSQSLIDSETNSLSNSTGWRRGVTYHRLPQGILGESSSRGPFLGNDPRVKELWMFSKCGFPVPHFFLQLDSSADSDQNGKWTWPATNIFQAIVESVQLPFGSLRIASRKWVL